MNKTKLRLLLLIITILAVGGGLIYYFLKRDDGITKPTVKSENKDNNVNDDDNENDNNDEKVPEVTDNNNEKVPEVTDIDKTVTDINSDINTIKDKIKYAMNDFKGLNTIQKAGIGIGTFIGIGLIGAGGYRYIIKKGKESSKKKKNKKKAETGPKFRQYWDDWKKSEWWKEFDTPKKRIEEVLKRTTYKTPATFEEQKEIYEKHVERLKTKMSKAKDKYDKKYAMDNLKVRWTQFQQDVKRSSPTATEIDDKYVTKHEENIKEVENHYSGS